MTVNYHRLTFKKRVAIYYLTRQGCSQREIARQLEDSPSTISRELKHNQTVKHYFPEAAHHNAKQRCFKQTRKIDQSVTLKKVVFSALRRQWSPEQISAYLKKKYDDTAMHVAPETIYTYLYVLPRGELRKELIGHLRQNRPKRRKHGKGNIAHAPIPD